MRASGTVLVWSAGARPSVGRLRGDADLSGSMIATGEDRS